MKFDANFAEQSYNVMNIVFGVPAFYIRSFMPNFMCKLMFWSNLCDWFWSSCNLCWTLVFWTPHCLNCLSKIICRIMGFTLMIKIIPLRHFNVIVEVYSAETRIVKGQLHCLILWSQCEYIYTTTRSKP